MSETEIERLGQTGRNVKETQRKFEHRKQKNQQDYEKMFNLLKRMIHNQLVSLLQSFGSTFGNNS